MSVRTIRRLPQSAAAPSQTTVSFPGLISDCECQFDTAGFSTDLAVPTYGWSFPEDEEAAEEAFPAQLLAAYQIFIQFFIASSKKVWVHLGAEMQAGKTGVVATLIRLILSNFRKLTIRPDHIFVITGMSDTAWKKQTKTRLIGDVRGGVEHNNGLDRVAREIRKIHSRFGELKNILIVIDESHIATLERNRPNMIVFNTIKELCPRDRWAENNIRFLTISATDPAKVLDITNSTENDATVVRLQTTPEYQSVATLKESNRIIPIQGDIHSEVAINKIREILADRYNNEPLYHILRPKAVNYQRVVTALTTNFPDADVVKWDAGSLKARADEGESLTSSLTSEDDINSLLEETPTKPTFILLKNMLYAAKTLDDTHVGILYDRVGAKDDTNLQSLLGRACGYGKSSRTVVFTSQQTVNNYLSFWRELCSKKGFPEQVRDIPVTTIDKRMPRIRAERRGDQTTLRTTGRSFGASGGASQPTSSRAVANENNFTSEWREFRTFQEAKAWGNRIHEKQLDEYGFYLSSTTSSTTVLSYDTVMGMKAGKKTANMPWRKLEVGRHVDRLYVGYRNTADSTSAVFIVRRLTRNA